MRRTYLHEKAAFLALGLSCGSDLKIRLSSRKEDGRGKTDLFLIEEKGRYLRVDVTEGHHTTVYEKIRRGNKVWVLEIREREDVVSIGADPCFVQAWGRLATEKPTSFELGDICPEHGENCPLVGKLVGLGNLLIPRIRTDFRKHFDRQALFV